MTRPALKRTALATLTAGLVVASSAGFAGGGEGITFRVGDGATPATTSPVTPGPGFRFPFSPPLVFGGYIVVLQPTDCIWNCQFRTGRLSP